MKSSRSTTGPKPCSHFWAYEHSIYSDDNMKDFCVRRCCNCKAWQRGTIKRWRTTKNCPVDPIPEALR